MNRLNSSCYSLITLTGLNTLFMNQTELNLEFNSQ